MITTSFGQYVKERREALYARDRRFSQRQVALRLGIQPGYLSRIERGEATHLSEKNIIALAKELEDDPDVLMALAGKVSADVQEAIRKRPSLFASLIRDLDELPDYAVMVDREYRLLENRLNEAQRIARIGSWELELPTNEVYWSKQLHHLFGLEPGEIKPGMDELLNRIHPEDRLNLEKTLKTLDPSFFDKGYQVRFFRKDGVKRVANFITHLETDEENYPIRVSGTLQDITEHKFWEEQHSSTWALLEKMFLNIHIMVAYLDTDFNFIRVNHAYAIADDRDPAFFIGKNYFDLFPHEENELIFRHVVETGKTHFHFAKSFEYLHNPERGITYWDWSLTPVKDSSGTVEGLVLCLMDVTDKVRAEIDLKSALSQLKEKGEGKFSGFTRIKGNPKGSRDSFKS